jgi:hypothetical protein
MPYDSSRRFEMPFIRARVNSEIYEKIVADMARSKRGVQGEVEYLLEKGLSVVEAEVAILEGRSQIDMVALRR